LTIIRIRYVDGARERYAMLPALRAEHANLPLLGQLEHSGQARCVVEAVTDADAARALLKGLSAPHDLSMMRGGTLRYGDAGAPAEQSAARAPESGSIRPLGAEQSNTSVRLDGRFVFKLFRRLDFGENPELEVSRFLTTRTGFRAMPELRGSLTYVSAAGEPSTVGVLQDWIDNHGDGWGHVTSQLRQADAATEWEALLRDLRDLGVTTAGFHAALSTGAEDPAFTPEQVTMADVESWRVSLKEGAARMFHLVERSIDGWAGDARKLGEALLDLRDRTPLLVEAPALTRPSAFHKIRIHGDYHLGQILRTSEGWVVTDFEGEPTRPLAGRCLKHCALKDVAGMIRSFDYAVDTACAPRSSARMSATLSRRLRESFLDGYVTSAIAHRADVLPRDRQALDAWVDFFELEKAFYEVEYEINNRPEWMCIPLRGILRIFRRQA
jgi:maltose alpha-D-glucosyltransferase/alpha-amylase